MLCALSGEAQEPPRRVVATWLIEEGVDPEQAKSILMDPRISVRPDIVLNNLFHSKPKGSRLHPDVMEIDPRQIERGRAFVQENEALLLNVEKRFGVSPRVVTAILLIESQLGNYPMPYPVANAYANLAFLGDPDYFRVIQERHSEMYPQLRDEATMARAKSKARWATGELVCLIHLANHLNMDPLSLSGSFAGAMGPAQFIPSSFWIFGLDADGDGLASPFNMADATLSMGHYLKKFGWREDAPPEQKRRALWYYNRSDVYVNTVMMIYERLQQ